MTERLSEEELTALERSGASAVYEMRDLVADLVADLRSARAERDLAKKIGAYSLEGWDKAQKAWERHMAEADRLRTRLEKAREALAAYDSALAAGVAYEAMADLRAALEGEP